MSLEQIPKEPSVRPPVEREELTVLCAECGQEKPFLFQIVARLPGGSLQNLSVCWTCASDLRSGVRRIEWKKIQKGAAE